MLKCVYGVFYYLIQIIIAIIILLEGRDVTRTLENEYYGDIFFRFI